MIIFLVLIYINRGLFIASAYEMENRGNKEINCVIELALYLITGEGNDIDEDGDTQTICHCVKIIPFDFSQQYLDLANLLSEDINKRFSNTENLPVKGFSFQIDYPPNV